MPRPIPSLLSLLIKEKKPLVKFPLVISESKLDLLKTQHYYVELKLNPKIIYDYNHVLLYYPYSMESLNYQSRYSTTRNMSLINLMVPVRWYKFINKLYILNKSHWNYYIDQRLNPTIELENFLELPIYYYYYARIRKRFLKTLPRTYLDYPYYKNLIATYERINFFFNNNYYWHLIFQDPLTQKLINLITKKGKKEKAELMIIKIFYLMNLTIGINEHPIYIIREAFQNVKPIVKLDNLSFRRRSQSVPNVISLRNQLKLAFKWILHEVNSNKDTKPFYYKLYLSLINAYLQKGYAYDQMIQVQKLAYDQRAFMYKNYYLRKKRKQPMDLYLPGDYPHEEELIRLEEEEQLRKEQEQKQQELNQLDSSKKKKPLPIITSKTRHLDVILNSGSDNLRSKKRIFRKRKKQITK